MKEDLGNGSYSIQDIERKKSPKISNIRHLTKIVKKTETIIVPSRKEVAITETLVEERDEDESEESDYCEIEKIKGHRVVRNENQQPELELKVKWKDYGMKHASWVKEADLQANELLLSYKKENLLA